MDFDKNNNTIQNITQEELDYLYAMYKSSMAGSSAKLTRDDLAKLLEHGKLGTRNKPEIDEKEIFKIATFITRTFVKSIDIRFGLEMGEEKWQNFDSIMKDQLVLLEFIKRYGMSPEEVRSFFISVFSTLKKGKKS